MLHHCYATQSYSPRELVVIDTGRAPSRFLQDRARRDANVIYRWFEDKRCWSLGLKRNLACYLARGDIVAHFDDDDLYARDYLAKMVGEIEQAAAAGPAAAEGEAAEAADAEDQSKDGDESGSSSPLVAATLAAWHVFDTKKRSFRVLRAVSDAWVYGWGFSFVYTREAWRRSFFPHMGIGEDFEFMMALRKLPGAKVLALDLSTACSHTHHPELSVSGGERRRGGPGSEEVRPPQELVGMLPMLLAANVQCLRDNGKREAIPEDEHSYFLVGSWSDWQHFDELRRSADGRTYSACIQLNGSAQTIEFQVFANRDWSMCYYPSTAGSISGPWRSPGSHWHVQTPKGCGRLDVVWDPAGDRSLQHSLGASGLAVAPVPRLREVPAETLSVPEWGKLPVHKLGCIHHAEYGADASWVDVRESLERARTKRRDLVVRNESFGCDPCPGTPKVLVVKHAPGA